MIFVLKKRGKMELSYILIGEISVY